MEIWQNKKLALSLDWKKRWKKKLYFRRINVNSDLISEKYKKACRALNYFEHFLAFASATSGCVSISAFASLVWVSIGIASSAAE